MKDVTITSFGLVIAYLLPGFAGLYGLSFWSARMAHVFSTFSTSASSIGLFLVVILASLILGLLANGVRWMIFEHLFFKKLRFQRNLTQRLSEANILAAFRQVIDETYRYHQWWGGIAVTSLIGCTGWVVGSWKTTSLETESLAILGCTIFEVFCFVVAYQTLRSTIERLHHILGVHP